MKKIITVLLSVLLAMLLFTGCDMTGGETEEVEPQETPKPMTAEMYTDREAVYQYYKAVTFDDTLETLTEKYGEPKVEEDENGKTYVWVMDDGFGFCTAFFDTGSLRAKVIYYEDVRQFGDISAADSIESFSNLSDSYTFEMTCGMLGGKPMEIAQIAQDSSADPEIKRLYAWANHNQDVVQILFSGEGKVESVTYMLANDGTNK